MQEISISDNGLGSGKAAKIPTDSYRFLPRRRLWAESDHLNPTRSLSLVIAKDQLTDQKDCASKVIDQLLALLEVGLACIDPS